MVGSKDVAFVSSRPSLLADILRAWRKGEGEIRSTRT